MNTETHSVQVGGLPHPASLAYGKLAVMTVDVQTYFLGDSKKRIKTLLRNNAALVKWAYAHGVPHFCVELHKCYDKTHPVLAQVMDERSIRLYKRGDGAFDGMLMARDSNEEVRLAQLMRVRGVESILMGGNHSMWCVAATECGALEERINVIEPVDTHANISRSGEVAYFGDSMSASCAPAKTGARVYRRDLALWKWLGLIDAANIDVAAWQAAKAKMGARYSQPVCA